MEKKINKSTTKSRLLVFDSQLLHSEGECFFGTEPRILFLNGLKDHFKSVYLFSRVRQVSDKHINEAFIIPKEIRIKPVDYPAGFISCFIKYFLSFPILIWQLKKLVRSEDYLYLSWPHPLSFFIWMAMLGRKKKPHITFVVRQNSYTYFNQKYTGLSKILYRYFLKKMELSLAEKGRYELVLCVGQAMYEKFKQTHPFTKLLYMPRVSEKDISEKNSFKNEFRLHLLYVSDHTDTGLESLILATGSIVKIGIDFTLDIVGMGKDFFTLQQLVIKQRLSDYIHFFPDVTYTNGLYKYYRNADLLIIPHVPSVLPKSVYDAMSFGLPIVAPKSEKLNVLLKHNENAWLFAPNDSCAMADAIYYLHKNKKLRQELGANFAKIGKEHTIEYQQKQFVSYLLGHDAELTTGRNEGKIIALGHFEHDGSMRKRLQWLMRIF